MDEFGRPVVLYLSSSLTTNQSHNYLREFRTKLISRREHLEAISISASASKTEKTKALKEIEKLKKTIAELDGYERETL